MIDLVALAAVLVPVATGAGAFVARVNNKLNTHVAEDAVIHKNVENGIARLEAKVDMLLEHALSSKK